MQQTLNSIQWFTRNEVAFMVLTVFATHMVFLWWQNIWLSLNSQETVAHGWGTFSTTLWVHLLMEAQKGWGWKAPLEVHLSNPLTQEGASWARCPGAFPDGFWASLGPCKFVFRKYEHRQYRDSQFFFSIVIYNLIMTIKLHWWKQLKTDNLFFLVFRNYITWRNCLLALIPGKFILNLKGRQRTYFSVKNSSQNKFAIFHDWLQLNLSHRWKDSKVGILCLHQA